MNNTELSEDLKIFYEHLADISSKQTVRVYKSSLSMLTTYLKDNNIELSEQSIRNWLTHLKEDGDSNKTLNRHLCALKSYLKFTNKLSMIVNIDSYLTELQEQIAIPIIQLKKLLDYCFGPFEILLITILISTGAKIGEIVALKKEQIIEHEESLILKIPLLKRKKQGFFRTVPIKSEWAVYNIKTSIQELEKGKPLEFIFLGKGSDSLRYTVKEIARRAGTPFIHPHTFRHTYITELYKRGVSIKQIRKLTGLSSTTTVEEYLHREDIQDIFNTTPEL